MPTHPPNISRSRTALPLSWMMGALGVALSLRLGLFFAGRRPVDDGYILLRYAWNLAHTGRWFFNSPDELTQGASSWLWALLLAPLARFLDPGAYAATQWLYVAGLLLQLGAVALLAASRADGADRQVHRASALALALAPTVAEQSFNGMEASLAIFILAMLLRSKTTSSTAWCALGLLPTVRPELALVAVPGIGVVQALWERKAADLKRRLPRAFGAVALPGFLVGGMVFFARGFRSPLPTTFEAKNQTYAALCLSAADPVDGGWLASLAGLHVAGGGGWREALGVAMCALVLGLSAVAVRREARKPLTSISSASLLVAWLGCVVFQVAVVRWRFPWYPAFAGALGAVLCARGVCALEGLRSKRTQVMASAVLVLLPLAVNLLKIQKQWAPTENWARWRGKLSPNDYEYVGQTLRQFPASYRVMLEPAGAIGYYSGLQVVDTIGLVSSDVTQLGRTHCWFDEAVQVLKPELIVLREFEIQNNRDFICGYPRALSCSSSPIPSGYRRVAKPPAAVSPGAPLTILERSSAL